MKIKPIKYNLLLTNYVYTIYNIRKPEYFSNGKSNIEEDIFMTPNVAPKGKMMLKVVGILYIIFAAISIITGLIAILGGGIAATASAGVGGLVILGGIVIIVGSILGLVAGILGVKNCDKPEKAQTCFVLGIVLIVFAALDLIGAISGNSSIWSALVGLVLPILYTVGAYQNKQS